MNQRKRLPGLPAWIFRVVVGHGRAEEILDEIRTDFQLRVARSTYGAHVWLWRQVLNPNTLRLRFELAELDDQQPTDSRGYRGGLMNAFFRDLRYGAQGLRNAPGFTLVSILTLALGIGATTTVFSLVNGVLFRPLPYEQPERIVWVSEYHVQRGSLMPVAWANFDDWQKATTAFEALAAYNIGGALVLGGDRPSSEQVVNASPEFWDVLGTTPIQGRLILHEEHGEGASPVVILREDYWQSHFGGRPIDGIRLEMWGEINQVVGIIPTSSAYPASARLWTTANPTSSSRTAHNWSVIGLLGSDITAGRAQSEVDALQNRLAQGEPEASDYLAEGARVIPLRERISGSVSTPLRLLLGASALVLLVACTNLASALLGRGAGRAREMAVRSSVGAGHSRLLSQLLTENLVLAFLGGAAGIALSYTSLSLIKNMAAGYLPRINQVSIDLRVLAFAAIATLGTTVLFGLIPALQVARQNVADVMRSGRGVREGGRSRGWDLLIASEIALAVILAVGSGLLLRSFDAATSVDTGLQPQGVMTMDVQLSGVKYPELTDHLGFYDEIVGRLGDDPSISAVAFTSTSPMSGGVPNGTLALDGDESKRADALYLLATGGLFEALGTPLLQGRVFDEQDRYDTRHVTIVNKAFADEYWPGEDPIGHQVSGGGMDEFWGQGRFATVIGVVGNARYVSTTVAPEPTVFMPITQRPGRIQYGAVLIARATNTEATSVIPALRSIFGNADEDIPLAPQSLESRLSDTLGDRRFVMLLLTAFAAIAMGLAALGVYGVVSYNMARRRREIGIRMALGAKASDVRRMIQGKILTVAVFGVCVGLLGALSLRRLLGAMLYQIDSLDPITFIGAAAVLVFSAWLAALLPAIRSSRLDPVSAIRSD